jgi:putative serine protease PepD
MSEHETDPQRSPASPDAEPSHPTAELPRVDRGQSDSATAPSPSGDPVGDPTSAVPHASSETGAAQQGPAPAAQPAPGQFHPAAPAGQYPPSPWQQGEARPGWVGNAGYPGPQTPGGYPAPYQAQPGGPTPPVWAQAPGTAGPALRPGRAAKIAAAVAAGLVLMGGSGIAGGVIALALDGNSSPTVNRTYSAAPIINGSDLPKIASAVQNSVVSITTGSGEGSGVVLSADGYILTNNHVVETASGDTVKVVFADGKSATAKIVGTDPKTDLAVVQASGVSDLAAAKFGDSDAMQVGDTVLALGSPLGLQGSVTAGIVSARDRTIQTGGDNNQQQNPFQQRQQQQAPVSSISGLLQTDAPINPGNSGGALVNTRGEVIGINTAIATAGQGSGNIGVGFAIPSNKAKAVAEALRAGKKVSHPSLGVSVGAGENGGALVNAVTAGSPAAKAGLQQGDVITKVGGKVINDSNDLVGVIQGGKVGDQIQVTYTRNGSEKTATVTLAETS